MELNLEDRVAFVAGSSRGIGHGIAQAFLAEGARVVLTGRDAGCLAVAARELETAAGGEGRILTIAGDLSDAAHARDAIARTLGEWGRLDCLVANVGSGTSVRGWEVGLEEWHRVFRENVWSGVATVEAALPAMLDAGAGSIVVIGSITGVEALGAPIAYGAAKAALVAYTKGLAHDVGPRGVRVNCVAPGNVLFPGGSWARRMEQDPERVREVIEREVPLRRFGTPAEVAAVVVFLASDRAAFVTGSCVIADGGQTRGY